MLLHVIDTHSEVAPTVVNNISHRQLTKLVLSIVTVIENTIKMRETFTLYYHLYLQLIVRFVVQVNVSVVPEALLEVGRVYSTVRRYTRYNKTS